MRPIDEKIVLMRLDNRNFEKNAKNSIKTLSDINKAASKADSTDFANSTKGLVNLEKQAAKVNLDSIGKSVDSISNKFSTMGIIGITALQNLTNRAIDSAIQIAKSFTFDPFRDGFAEYGLKLESTQTILANVKRDGKTLEDVNKVLRDMNEYSDKTIYNFAQMTKNMSLFTNAGIDLESSSSMIQGLMNEAAVSGASNEDAQRAAYQLSQALNTGIIRLMDWRSITNANMGGANMREAIIEIATLRGYLNEETRKLAEDNFNASLSSEWFDASIIEEYLNIMAGAYSEADLLAEGYSEAQVKRLINQQKEAEKAATQVRTIPKLIDTGIEQIGSKWAEVFELIIGDFEDAPARLTIISEAFGSVVESIFEPIIGTLKRMEESGAIEAIWQGFFNIGKAISTIFGSISNAIGELLPDLDIDLLSMIAFAFRDITQAILNLVSGVFPKLSDVARVIGAPLEVVLKILEALVNSAIDLGSTISNSLNIPLKNFVDFLKGIVDSIGPLVSSFFDSFTNVLNSMLESVTSGIDAFVKAIGSFISGMSQRINLEWIPEGINSIVNSIKNLTVGAGDLQDTLTGIGQGIGTFFNGVVSTSVSMIEDFLNFLTGNSVVKAASEADEKVSKIVENSKWALPTSGGIVDWLGEQYAELASILSPIVDFIGRILTPVINGLKNIVENLTFNDLLSGALFISITKFFKKIDSGISSIEKTLKSISSGVRGVSKSFKELPEVVKSLKGALTGLRFNFIAEGLKAVAISVLIMVGALWALSKIPQDKLKYSLEALTIGLTAMSVTLAFLSKVDTSNVKTTKIMGLLISLAIGMRLMAGAMKSLSGLNSGDVASNMGLMGVLVAGIVLLTKKIEKKDVLGLTALSKAIRSLSISILIMSLGMKLLGGMDGDSLLKGVAAIAALLTITGAFAKLTSGVDLTGTSVALLGLAVAIDLLVAPLAILGLLPSDMIFQGVASLGALLVMIGLFAKLSSKLKGFSVAASLLSLALAMNMLVVPMLVLGSIDFSTLVQGLFAVATVLGVVVGAGYLASGATVGLLALTKAIASMALLMGAIGLSMIAVGAGIAAMALGVRALVTIGPAFVDALVLMIEGVILAILNMAPQIAEGIVNFIDEVFKSLERHMPSIAESIIKIIIEILEIVADNVRPLMNAIGKIIKELIEASKELIEEIPADEFLKAIIAIGGISVLAKALAPLPRLLPKAMLGAAAAGALLVEVGFVLTAIGMLYGIDGASDLVRTGGDFLTMLASIIGNVVGAFVASLSSIIAESLPGIGTNLSSFAENLKPFITHVGRIDPVKVLAGLGVLGSIGLAAKGLSLLGGVSVLKGLLMFAEIIGSVGIILTILGGFYQIPGLSEIISDGGSFLTTIGNAIGGFLGGIVGSLVGGLIGGAAGGLISALPGIGSDLSDFMDNASGFFDAIDDIDSSIIDSAKTLADTLLILSKSGLKSTVGNIISFWSGGSGSVIIDLGNTLGEFGSSLKDFSDSSEGIDAENIAKSVEAGRSIADLAESINGLGFGLESILSGHESLDTFGSRIKSFGESLVEYSDVVKDGIDNDAIDRSIVGAEQLVALSNSLEKTGGLFQMFTGSKNLSVFGRQLPDFGEGLKTFSDNVDGIDVEDVENAAVASESLMLVAKNLTNTGGLIQLIAGKKDLGNFGETLPNLGEGLSSFADSVSDIKAGDLDGALTAVDGLVAISNGLDNTGGLRGILLGNKTLAGFGSDLEVFGGNLSAFSEKVVTVDKSSMNYAVNYLERITSLDSETLKTNVGDMASAGIELISYGTKLESFNEVIKNIENSKWELVSINIERLSDGFVALQNVDVDLLGSLVLALSSVGSDSIGEFIAVFYDREEEASDAIISFINAMADAMDSESRNKMTKSGESALNNFISGLNSKTGARALRRALSTIRSLVYNSLSNISLYSYGANATMSFANGILSNRRAVTDNASIVASAAAVAMRRTLDINSPSRVTGLIGEQTISGFLNKLISGKNRAKEAAMMFTESAVSGVRSVADKFASIVDDNFEYRPVISPVLDMGGVNYGLSEMEYGRTIDINETMTTNRFANSLSTGRERVTIPYEGMVNNNSYYYYDGLMDGARFYIREDADIDKIRQSIKKLDNEDIVRSGRRR